MKPPPLKINFHAKLLVFYIQKFGVRLKKSLKNLIENRIFKNKREFLDELNELGIKVYSNNDIK